MSSSKTNELNGSNFGLVVGGTKGKVLKWLGTDPGEDVSGSIE